MGEEDEHGRLPPPAVRAVELEKSSGFVSGYAFRHTASLKFLPASAAEGDCGAQPEFFSKLCSRYWQQRHPMVDQRLVFGSHEVIYICTVSLDQVSESTCVSTGKIARHTRRLAVEVVAEMRVFHEKDNVLTRDGESRHTVLGSVGSGRCH